MMNKIIIVIGVVLLGISFGIGYKIGKSKASITIPIATVDVQNQSKTVIAYEKKQFKNDADIDVNVAKTQLKIKVNGVEQVITKDDNEETVLEKNKVTLNQDSKTSISIKTEKIDMTRHWRAGIGYSNHGACFNLNFPIYKYLGGFSYLDQETISAGISVGF